MELDTQHFMALLPVIALTAASVIVMLCAAFHRRHLLIATLTLLGLLVSLLCLQYQADSAPNEVTTLMVFDRFSVFFMALILGATAVITVFCYSYFNGREGLQEELYILLLTAALGALVLVSSAHFASFFLGLEILSVSLFAMVAYPVTTLTRSTQGSADPLEAGIKYLILSGISSAILAMGMAFVYAATGELNFSGIDKIITQSDPGIYAVAGVTLMIAGVGFKLSLVPFHMWTPDVYQGAPAPVTAFLSTVSKSAILALILRGFIALDGYRYEGVLLGISVIAMASMLIGNLLALRQNNIKRLLAYSSISHSGYILVAFLAAMSVSMQREGQTDPIALEAVTYYIVTYVLTTLTAFGVVSVMSSSNHLSGETRDADRFDDYAALFWRRPIVATVFTITLLSSAGIPLTIGFIGKFYVFSAGVNGALWLPLMVLIASSGIGLFYYLRLILVMFKTESDHASDSTGAGNPVAGEGGHWGNSLIGAG
ncbi:MAG TPA: NADH-quinone oxidoreductase subunit N, partial [Dongiaceae bacterium]|nr:NADH-quinone oxidoreductase subunit N [Dongiaceae bacterium]